MESTVPINATCPECRGPLSSSGDSLEIRCLVGHVYSPRTLLQAHYETQERTLWAAVVALEEAAKLVDAVASHFSDDTVDLLRKQVDTKLQQAKQIRAVLDGLEAFRIE